MQISSTSLSYFGCATMPDEEIVRFHFFTLECSYGTHVQFLWKEAAEVHIQRSASQM